MYKFLNKTVHFNQDSRTETQTRSLVLLNRETNKLNRLETKDSISLLLNVFDSLYNLCEKLSRLSYLVERKIIEIELYNTQKGEKK